MTREDRLADLLERWENAATSGRRPTPEEFCKDTPEDLPAFVELLHQLGLAGLVTNTGKRTSDTQPAGFRAGRYMATEYHAAGGLGVVYRAQDEELNRTVALKCMKTAAGADSPAGKRFLLEAEVTSQLEHPGIAPVHGRGRTEDGRPFYTMRFIEGETLQDATRRYHAPAGVRAERRCAEMRRLLRAFVGVCETVAYAHSKGVIHRDLKPSNVMVGPFGEVLVMDWGLAKQLGSQTPEVSGQRSEEYSANVTAQSVADTPVDFPDTPSVDLTIYGRAKGSPSFMSPEQARGEWDRVGPASDIYSLGSTLFYVLTGRAPYDGRTSAEVVAKVKDGAFPSARSVNSDVPAALDAICRKAMAFDPDDRYLSAGALADDLERWLADEPVLAWKEPFAVRARRWARRHRTLVTATAAALVVGFVLLAFYGYRLDRKNRDLDRVNNDLKQANDREKTERQKADERFQNALGSASLLASDIQIKLIRAPGTRAVRESLLQAAIKQLEDLVRKADETRDANQTMVWARLRLGDLYRDSEQNPTKAKVEYLRGLELARLLRDRNPNDPSIAIDLAETLHRLGQVEVQLGHFATAASHYTEAVGLIEVAGPVAEELKAKNLTLQGQLDLEMGDAPTAAGRFREARRIWEPRAADPANVDAAIELGGVLLAQGLTAVRTGQLNDAASSYSAALRQWQTVQTSRPNDVTVGRRLAIAHKGLAETNLQLGKHADAASHGGEFLRICDALASQDPTNGEAQLELAMAHNAAAADALKQFDLKSADAHATDALRVVRQLALIDPNNLDARRDVVVGLSELARVAKGRQRPQDAVGYFNEAAELCRGILKVAPDRTATVTDLAELLKDLGMLYFQVLKDKPKGIATVGESLSLWRRLIAIDSAILRWQQRGLETGRLLGKYQVELKKLDEAGATIRATLASVEPLSAEDRAAPIIRREVGMLHIDLAKLSLELRKSVDAIRATEDEIQLLEKEARERPNDVHPWQLLGGNHAFLADLYTRQRNVAKGTEHLRKAIDAAEHGLKLDPEDNLLRGELQLHLSRLGQAALTTDPATSLKHYEAALAHSPRFPTDLAETSILLNRFAAFEAKAGDCCEMLNRPTDALAHYQKALEHHTRVGLIEVNEPRVPAYIAYDHRRIAEIRLYLLDFAGAQTDYEKAQESVDLVKGIKEPIRPLDAVSLADLATTESQIKMKAPFVRSLPQGIETLDAALKQPPRVRHLALRVRIAWLIKEKKFDEAAEAAEHMTTEKAFEDNAFALAAVEFSRLAATKSPTAKAHAARAIELLSKAKDEGYFKDPEAAAWLNWEPLFDSLRKEEGFQKLVKEIGDRKK